MTESTISEQTELSNDGTLYCANHPNTETLLRCNRCEKPMCLKCAKQTAVGYRCNECLREVQSSYFNAEGKDNPVAFIVAFFVTLISTPIAGLLLGIGGFFGIILAFILGSGAGGALAQIIRSAIGKRRGRNLRWFALGGIIFGFLGGILLGLLFFGGIPGSLSLLIFVFLAGSTAVGMLR